MSAQAGIALVKLDKPSANTEHHEHEAAIAGAAAFANLSTLQTVRKFWKATMMCFLAALAACSDGYQYTLPGAFHASFPVSPLPLSPPPPFLGGSFRRRRAVLEASLCTSRDLTHPIMISRQPRRQPRLHQHLRLNPRCQRRHCSGPRRSCRLGWSVLGGNHCSIGPWWLVRVL